MFLDFWQIERIIFSPPRKSSLQICFSALKLKNSATHIVGFQRRPIAERSRQIHGFSVLIGQFKSHARRLIFHQLAAFGIESADELFLRFASHILFRSRIHILPVVIALIFGLAIDWQHARKQAVPLAEKVRRHLVIIKKVAVVARILAVRHVEIQHPARVGPQFVVARIERVLQHELAAGVALSADDDSLPLDHESVGREQFHVEQSAHISRSQVVGPQNIGFIPQRVAHEIARVVRVDIHFFLHLAVRRQRVLQLVETVGECRQKSRRQQAKYQKNPFHRSKILISSAKIVKISRIFAK